jgi:hypothetical protein
MDRPAEPSEGPAPPSPEANPPPAYEPDQPLPETPAQGDEGRPPARQEQREERRRRERQRITKHGASLRRVYRDAVSKRAAAGRKRRGKA